ncbi:MAG: response regulator [Flavobacteriales bacterium]
MYRTIVKEYLISTVELKCLAECSDGFQGVKAISEHNPDLVFLDVQMPKINGLNAGASG